MRLHLHGGMLGAAEFALGSEIEVADALAAGYRIHQDDDERGFIHGTPMMRCKWSAWVGSPVAPRPETTATPKGPRAMPEFTDEQIEHSIKLALERQDVQVIPSLIALLAIQNPHRAEIVRDTILLGLSIAAETGDTR